MARLFPFRPERAEVDRPPRLVGLEDTMADEVFAALSSDMARSILSQLYEEPTTASEVADAVDTSLQNARYHLDKLLDAGLVEEIDTWYSSRGTEMTVYGPTNEPLVLAAGREESTGTLRDVITRVLGAVGILGLASLLVDRFARFSGAGPGTSLGGADDPDAVGDGNGGGSGDSGDGGNGGNGFGDGNGGNGGDGSGDTYRVESTDASRDATQTPPGASDDDAAGTVVELEDVPEAVETTVATTSDPGTTTAPTEALADGGSVDLLASLSPGELFFAGGLLTIALAVGWWYAFRYRRYYA